MRCVASECIRDAVAQINAFRSPCESNSCAAAVCTSVRGYVSGDREVLFFFLMVCASECERQKSNCHNLRCTSDPTVLVFLLRFADSRKTNKEHQKCASTGSSERKEVGVRREGAGWNNTIKNCFISALPTDRRWRKIANPLEEYRMFCLDWSIWLHSHTESLV